MNTDFENSNYLAKWLVLGTIIGLIAGIGAIIFSSAIEIVTEVALGDIVGYLPPHLLARVSRSNV